MPVKLRTHTDIQDHLQNEDSFLHNWRITEGVFLIKHKVEADSKCPHVDLKPIGFVGIELGAHVVARPKHSFTDVGSLAETEVCNFVSLLLSNGLLYCPTGLFSPEYSPPWCLDARTLCYALPLAHAEHPQVSWWLHPEYTLCWAVWTCRCGDLVRCKTQLQYRCIRCFPASCGASPRSRFLFISWFWSRCKYTILSQAPIFSCWFTSLPTRSLPGRPPSRLRRKLPVRFSGPSYKFLTQSTYLLSL